jgi:hypothetical protein
MWESQWYFIVYIIIFTLITFFCLYNTIIYQCHVISKPQKPWIILKGYNNNFLYDYSLIL